MFCVIQVNRSDLPCDNGGWSYCQTPGLRPDDPQAAPVVHLKHCWGPQPSDGCFWRRRCWINHVPPDSIQVFCMPADTCMHAQLAQYMTNIAENQGYQETAYHSPWPHAKLPTSLNFSYAMVTFCYNKKAALPQSLAKHPHTIMTYLTKITPACVLSDAELA